MNRKNGFTLIEVMVVIAIMGILGATAVHCYHTIKQRACGSEASCMVKQILEAEIMHYLAHDTFFPEVGQTMMIFHNDLPSKAEIAHIGDALKVTIPVGHLLDFTITTLPGPLCMVTVSSAGNSFPLFKNGSPSITGVVDGTGKVDIF